jgi:hypothetical protein
MELTPVNLSRSRSSGRGQQICEGSPVPSRLPIADWENFAARRVESVWLAETGAAPENRVFLRTGKI